MDALKSVAITLGIIAVYVLCIVLSFTLYALTPILTVIGLFILVYFIVKEDSSKK